MSFIAELKQRKVFRVATVYLVVAWVAIQAASIALPAFEAPAWVMRVVILLFALGFPVALMLAWALEWTTEGVKLDAGGAGSKHMLIVTAALAMLAIAWYFLGQPGMRRIDLARTTAAAPAVAERSIAVLPFVNMSGDPKNEYFSDGLAETTLDMLAQVPDLKVIARTSSFAFKGKPQDMRKIGAALGAANLLEGSVQQAGDTLRITVQLIKAADGSHLWSHHYDRPMVDVFKIQDEIASQVVQELAIALPAKQQKRLTQKRTDSVAAYNEYTKGRDLMPGRKVADMREAVQHFERAIALDPNYALAHAAASDAYFLLDSYGTITVAERARGKALLDRALALAPDLGEAHISLANRLSDSDFAGAEREYRRGIALAPSYATGYQWYGELLDKQGRVEESLAMQLRSAALDPLSPIVQGSLVRSLANTGRIKEAESLLAKLQASHPDFAFGYATEAFLAALQGDLMRTLRAMHKVEDLRADRGPNSETCLYLMRFGALDHAHRCVDASTSTAPDSRDAQRMEILYKYWSGNAAAALAQWEQIAEPDSGDKAILLLSVGRYAEALALYRRIAPDLFIEPIGKLYPGQSTNALYIGFLLMQTGSQAQGTALLQQALLARANLPHLMTGNEWQEVRLYDALGEHELAIVALKKGVAEGYFLDLVGLDSDPLLAKFRSDPRYQQILTPARAKAATQVAAARAAGLLASRA